MRIPSTVLVPVSVLLCGLAPPAAVADDYAYFSAQESRGSSGDQAYGLANGVLVCEQKPTIKLRPIAWFGAVKPNDGKSQFLYLMIFKTPADFDPGSVEVSFDVRGSSDTGAEGKVAARVGKKKLERLWLWAQPYHSWPLVPGSGPAKSSCVSLQSASVSPLLVTVAVGALVAVDQGINGDRYAVQAVAGSARILAILSSSFRKARASAWVGKGPPIGPPVSSFSL